MRGQTDIYELLDIGVADEACYQLFPQFKVSHLSWPFSDHCPIVIDTRSSTSTPSGAWNFKFEAKWLLEASCEVKAKRL